MLIKLIERLSWTVERGQTVNGIRSLARRSTSRVSHHLRMRTFPSTPEAVLARSTARLQNGCRGEYRRLAPD